MKLLFLISLLVVSLFAKEEYSLRLAYGEATESDFSEIFAGDIRETPSYTYYVTALDAGYLYSRGLSSLPIDTYIKAGLAYYQQHVFKDTYEATLYIKFYYNIDFLDNRVRIALGEGISYTHEYLEPEYNEAVLDKDSHSHFLNYLDFSVDVDMGRLLNLKSLYDTYMGWAIKHRSGIFGLINNVKEGGANYNTFYIEKNF